MEKGSKLNSVSKGFVSGESYRGMCGAKTEGGLKVFIALGCLGGHAKNRAAIQRSVGFPLEVTFSVISEET